MALLYQRPYAPLPQRPRGVRVPTHMAASRNG
nr:MAG TPA: hypothetical protein [Caudoviricetes sp.]